MEIYTTEEARELLVQRIKEVGTQQEMAKYAGVSAPYISDVMNGNRRLTDRILELVGLQWAIVDVVNE